MSDSWPLWQRVLFRFCVCYFGLFCALQQPLASFAPMFDFDGLYAISPVRDVVFWVAAYVFHANLPLVYTGSGSGDKVYDWVFLFVLVVFSALITLFWSILDRKREQYTRAFAWFRLFIRFMLAGQLIVYGLSKVIPEQMPVPSLFTLVEPFGNFSPMGVLWSSIGASPAYEMFAGSAEFLAGVLLIFPRTTMLGALLAFADMTQVFMLNMTYDVPVKLLSFHLLVFAVFLLAPDLRRLANFFLLNRAVPASHEFPLHEAPRTRRSALIVQVVLGAYLVASYAFFGWLGWFQYGGGVPKSELYGIWNIQNLSLDKKAHPLLATDSQGWRRVIFDRSLIGFQQMNDTFVRYLAAVDPKTNQITLRNFGGKTPIATLTYKRVGNDRLVIDGILNKQDVHLALALLDRNNFTLFSRGFHLVQDYPYNR